MDRDDFINKKRLPIRRGQRWALIEPWHANSLPRYIEIIEVKPFTEGSDQRYKCKIREFYMNVKETYSRTPYRTFASMGDEEISQYMFPGDILTFYEQI